MSNLVVGTIYETIINRIVIEAQNDFEEAGLEQETLQELKQHVTISFFFIPVIALHPLSMSDMAAACVGAKTSESGKWQSNITGMHIANCPWDPSPPPQQVANPPTLPSNVKSEGYKPEAYKVDYNKQDYKSDPNGLPIHQQHAHNGPPGEPRIKQERPDGRPTHIQLPGQRPPQQQPHAHQPSNQGPPQTDGAGDSRAEWAAMLAERRGRSNEDRLAADDAFHVYLKQAAAESDNGIMMPLSDHPSVKNKSRGKRTTSSQLPIRRTSKPSIASRSIAQLDGGDDDEDVKPKIEADEDAINSDLDDSEDELENPDQDDQEGGNVGETILCTYDKVQRVKNKWNNKWKCVLKDGILTTGGKEFVFHKATGEFEW
ncbi:hypothetical protein EG327_003225 [Venturia inaequalis]|uniref:Uncharacterized protein n=1 Tax=Venturia inaequalis TaxID=5025 RepID=A0A8H3VH88_VENIN|nr:hypothetical protein EG327_003225 [Venturia inaequalis]